MRLVKLLAVLGSIGSLCLGAAAPASAAPMTLVLDATTNRSYDYDGGAIQNRIRFDAPSATSPAGKYAWLQFPDVVLPPGATLVSATLQGWVKNLWVITTSNPEEAFVYRLLDDIGNRPMAPGSITDGAGTFYDNSVSISTTHPVNPGCPVSTLCIPPPLVEWDVSQIVQEWLSGAPNHGVLFFTESTNAGELVNVNDTGELEGLRPKLRVEFVLPEPSALALLGSAALVGFAARRRR